MSGLAPAAVSTSVNLAKVVTGFIAGFSHWRFRNLDRGLVFNLAVPGCLGAIGGVTLLSSIDGATLRPYLAMLLTLVAIRILVRFSSPLPPTQATNRRPDGRPRWELQYDRRGLKLVAFLGGVTNGLIGAWGPVVTPFLLHRAIRPRFAIGCVNTAEIAVASASAFSLIASLGMTNVNGALLIAMLLGGALGAPVAAWLIRYVRPQPMGIAVAGLLLLTNARDLTAWVGLTSGPWVWVVYAGIISVVLLTPFVARGRASRGRSAVVAVPVTFQS